jgi:cytochrome c
MKAKFLGFDGARHAPALFAACILAALSAPAPAHAGDPRGCGPVKDADFTMTTLVSQTAGNLQEPLRMAFDMSEKGDVDIYFVEKAGKVRKYDGATKQVSTLGSISVRTTGEHGLLGIALDPAFKANHWVYLFYGAGSGTYQFRLSRFTLSGASLDMASEKIMLRIPADNNSWHTGGALAFDRKGDLWVTVGDNKSDEGGSPNTNSYLGKILRIHPKEDGTYSIPEGNLFPEGTAKTLPEIYVMGDRNPYSIAVDPVKNWVAWGEVGPDGFGQTEEFNVTAKPMNGGWPYFAGNNMVLKQGKDPKAPVNNSTLNTGLQNLPPSTPASYPYNQSCAITGPIYRYDAYPNHPGKLPPHFDGTWFVTDFNNYGNIGQTMDTMSLSATATPGKFGRIWPSWKLSRPTEFQVGPDGNLYAMNYSGYFSTDGNTAIVRIAYNGTCQPPVDPAIVIADRAARMGMPLEAQGTRVRVLLPGRTSLRVLDMAGRTALERTVEGGSELDLAAALPGRHGLFVVEAAAAARSLSARIVLP